MNTTERSLLNEENAMCDMIGGTHWVIGILHRQEKKVEVIPRMDLIRQFRESSEQRRCQVKRRWKTNVRGRMEKAGVTLILVPSWKQTGNSSLKATKLWGCKMTHGLVDISVYLHFLSQNT